MIVQRDSSVNIPIPPDQHHCSDEAKWRIRGSCTDWAMLSSNYKSWEVCFVLMFVEFSSVLDRFGGSRWLLNFLRNFLNGFFLQYLIQKQGVEIIWHLKKHNATVKVCNYKSLNILEFHVVLEKNKLLKTLTYSTKTQSPDPNIQVHLRSFGSVRFEF